MAAFSAEPEQFDPLSYKFPPRPAEPTMTMSTVVDFVESSLALNGYRCDGDDSSGRNYETPSAMWKAVGVLSSSSSSPLSPSTFSWYSKGEKYWEDESNCPTTIDGVLGGFAHISDSDVAGSSEFIRRLKAKRPELNLVSACDCGAGIGRVARDLLLPNFSGRVTCVEVSERLVKASPDFVGVESSRCKFLNLGLQDFDPSAPSSDKFDVVWIQWVIGQLTDIDFVNFLKRAAAGLNPGGVIVIKDNSCASEDDENSDIGGIAFSLDLGDCSVCRSFQYFQAIIELADLEIVMHERQQGFPEEIFPVPMIALSPKRRT